MVLSRRTRQAAPKLRDEIASLWCQQARPGRVIALSREHFTTILDVFDDASQIGATAEPLLLWLKADVEWMPVMLPEDLAKAGPAIEAAVEKWG